MKETKFEQITDFTPAYDKRDPDPSKNYGIGSVKCRMILKNDKGAVQFVFGTGILLPRTVREYIETGKAKYEITEYGSVHYLNSPMGYDVGYHALKPEYEGQTPMGKCDLYPDLPNGCYYDGSSLRAAEWFDIFIKEGSSKIWEMLEENHKELFK